MTCGLISDRQQKHIIEYIYKTPKLMQVPRQFAKIQLNNIKQFNKI